jgi:hypothetical protein
MLSVVFEELWLLRSADVASMGTPGMEPTAGGYVRGAGNVSDKRGRRPLIVRRAFECGVDERCGVRVKRSQKL